MPERSAPALDQLTVGIITFKRPAELERLLSVLDEQEPDLRNILVVDNDAAASAREVAEGAGDRVIYVHEPQAGTSHARNRLMDECPTRWLASIDDDEVPLPGWPGLLLEAATQTGAGLVAGPVLTEFEVEPEPWVVQSGIFDRPSPDEGTTLPSIRGGNLLVDLEQVRPLGIRYDPDFSKGGQDIRFSLQVSMAGVQIVWTKKAVVVEHVTGERLSRAWVKERWAKTYCNHWRARVVSGESRRADVAIRAISKPGLAAKALLFERSTIAGAREWAHAKGAVQALRATAKHS